MVIRMVRTKKFKLLLLFFLFNVLIHLSSSMSSHTYQESTDTFNDHENKNYDLDINKILASMNGNEKIRHMGEIKSIKSQTFLNNYDSKKIDKNINNFEENFARSIKEKNEHPEYENVNTLNFRKENVEYLKDDIDKYVNVEAEMKKYNKFQKNEFDKNYPIHNLCDEKNSGHQTDNLLWSESADRILKVIGNGVVKNGYNMFEAPSQREGKSTNVSVAIYIESMSSFKAQTMDFELDFYLALAFYDRRLAHNCTHPILVAQKFIADRIWFPDIYIINSKFLLQEVTTPNFMVLIYPDGLIFKSMRIDVTLSCMMDLKNYPMDTQSCPITMQSYAHINQLVELNWHNAPPYFPIGSNEEIKLNDMQIIKTNFEKCSGPYPMFRGSGEWSCIRAYIVMKRLVLFHVIQTYLPTGMLVVVSWMSFWLDPRASPARISLTITGLLTLTTMSNGARQDLPQVSYIKALDIWLTFSQALIFLVLMEYSFVSYYMTKKTVYCKHKISLKNEIIHNDSGKKYSISNGNGSILKNNYKKKNGNEWNIDVREGERKKHKLINNSYRNRSEECINRIRKIKCSPPNEILIDERKFSSNNSDPFSLSNGIGKCLSTTAMLCNNATNVTSSLFVDKLNKKVSNVWFEVAKDIETAALMSGNTINGNIPLLDFKFDETKPCVKCQEENEEKARLIDSFSRTAFPTIFFIFVCWYWWYFNWHNQTE
uniref:Neur_chan_LBD domain-containing protein n=1 Tax=Strongyloides stercoralis TaxID=6248 RepID=A0A913I4W5_STRER